MWGIDSKARVLTSLSPYHLKIPLNLPLGKGEDRVSPFVKGGFIQYVYLGYVYAIFAKYLYRFLNYMIDYTLVLFWGEDQ